jgi:hypothetical protein
METLTKRHSQQAPMDKVLQRGEKKNLPTPVLCSTRSGAAAASNAKKRSAHAKTGLSSRGFRNLEITSVNSGSTT